MSDEEQLEFAIGKGMAILTHDRTDFEELANSYFTGGKTHQGIIIAYPRFPQLIAERLSKVLNRITADEMPNQIIYI